METGAAPNQVGLTFSPSRCFTPSLPFSRCYLKVMYHSVFGDFSPMSDLNAAATYEEIACSLQLKRQHPSLSASLKQPRGGSKAWLDVAKSALCDITKGFSKELNKGIEIK